MNTTFKNITMKFKNITEKAICVAVVAAFILNSNALAANNSGISEETNSSRHFISAFKNPDMQTGSTDQTAASETENKEKTNSKDKKEKNTDKKSNKENNELNLSDYKSNESYIPKSSDIQNLLSASNDLSLMIPKEKSGKWGLVLSYNAYKFTNEDKSNQVADTPDGLLAPDARIWFGKKLDNNDSYYARIRYGRINLQNDTNLATPNSKNIGLKFDMLYYTINRRPDVNIKIGRQYLKVGRGITYANIHDGLSIEKIMPEWTLNAFGARTQPRETNLDQSNNGYLDRSHRDFYAFEANYYGISGKKLYGYFLLEKDGNVKIPYSTKDFTYDANYIGLGMEGSFKPNWPYYFEYVNQGGKTASSNAQTGTDSIKANSYTVGTEYYFENNKMKPYLALEYQHASGDPDRRSLTNVLGGNASGTDDKNFMPFGIYDLGLALHPRFSNINALKFGGFIKPFYNQERFKELQLGAKYFIYEKADANGVSTDGLATNYGNKKLGNGYDLYLTWRLFSDTLIYVNYGEFKPGDAYPTTRRDTTKLLNLGTTLFF